MSRTPTYRYIVATVSEQDHVVAVTYQDKPGIWRVIASFAARERADDFAEIENEFATEEWPEETGSCRGGECSAPSDAEIPDEPKSALVPGQIVRVKDAEKLAIAPAAAAETSDEETSRHHEEPSEPESAGDEQEGPEEAADETEDANHGDDSLAPELPADEPDVAPMEVESEGSASLAPLSPQQASVLKALQSMERGTPLADIAKMSDSAQGSIVYLMETLARKGYAENRGARGAPDWVPLFHGEPEIFRSEKPVPFVPIPAISVPSGLKRHAEQTQRIIAMRAPQPGSRAEIGVYLKEKKVEVTVIGVGRFRVRGEVMNHEDLLEFANDLRHEDGLSPFKFEDA
jgi:hypothetical protein